ncbi:MAG: TIGR04211 family SH3 domain-containing protein [Desulfocapsa sp.]|nr:TIGR04211 family SH3 domain-containing protein [Desulfocapsa sp.]
MVIRQTQHLCTFHSFFLFALILFALSGAILLSGTKVLAETRYIQPSSEVAVRRGQGVDFKIISMIKDGTPVEFLEEDESYARIRLQNGKEGWMLKRFLSESPPLDEVVASLRTEKNELEQKESELMQNIEEISSSLAQTRTELDSIRSERDRIWADFQILQEETTDVVQTKKELLETRKKNEQLLQELTATTRNSQRLKKNSAIKWFLTGGGVLILGMIIGGVLSGKSRRRGSLQL